MTLPPLREAEGEAREPWTETVLFGSAAELRALLDQKFDPNSATPGGTTALMLAMPDLEKAKLLVQHGANVNALDKNGMTPLMYAASIDYGDSAMIDLLVKSGANREARTKDGLSAVELARKYEHAHVLKSLE